MSNIILASPVVGLSLGQQKDPTSMCAYIP